MKKIVSMCAAFAMLLTVLCAVPAQAAPYDGYAFVYEDFEDGTTGGITNVGATWSAGGYNGSAGALQLSGTGDLLIPFTADVPSNQSVTFSFKAKFNVETATDMSPLVIVYSEGTEHYKTQWWHDFADRIPMNNEWVDAKITLSSSFLHSCDICATDGHTGGPDYVSLRFDSAIDAYIDEVKIEPAAIDGSNNGVKTVFYEDFNGSSVASNMAFFTSMFTKASTNDSNDGTSYYKSTLGDYGDGGCGFIPMTDINFEYGHTYEISYDYRIDERSAAGATVLNTWLPQGKLYILQHNATSATDGVWYTYRNQFSFEGKTEQDIFKSHTGGSNWEGSDFWAHQLKFGSSDYSAYGNNNAAMSLDNFKIVDLGIVSNGDMETTAGDGNVALTDTANNQWGNESQLFPGWRSLNGASIAATDDVRPGSTGTRAMQVDLQSVEEGVIESPYQTVNLGANGSSKKLSFWAKAQGGNPSNGQAIIMVLDRSSATKTVYDVPDYQYYTGGQCYNTLEEAQAAENKWIIWDAYYTNFTCDLVNTFGVIEGATEADGTVPSSAYMYFIAGNNAAWTMYYLDDVEITDGSIPAVSDITVTGDFEIGKQVTVNWTYAGPGEDASFARIIGTVNGKDVSLGTVANGGTYTVPMAAAGKTLRIEIAAMNNAYTMGPIATKAVELTGTFGTISVDPDFYDATIMYSEDAAGVTVIWAVYADGELVEMVYDDIVDLTAMEEVEVYCPGISEDGEVVVMVWENFTSVKPLMASCTVGQ